MELALSTLAQRDAYKLLTGIVLPRPIAWVSTVDREGNRNLAPFSFFNAVSSKPPAISLSISHVLPLQAKQGRKDTLRNIFETGQFVVNVVDEELAIACNETAIDFPMATDEFEIAGVTPIAGKAVCAPRVAESPVSMECELLNSVRVGEELGGATLVLGTIRILHIRQGLVNERCHVDLGRLAPIGRLAGTSYTYVRETFEIPSKSL